MISRKQKATPTSFYQTLTLSPQNGGTILLNTQANSQQTLFEVPSGVFNHHNTILRFTQPQIAAAANSYFFNPANYFPYITKLEFFSSDNNIYLVNVFDVQKVSKLVGNCNLNPNDRTEIDGYCFNSQRKELQAAAAGYAGNIGFDDPFYYTNPNVALGAQSGLFSIADNFNVGSINYMGGNALVNQNFGARQIAIKLRDLLGGDGNFFCLNKDISYDKMYLRITWNSVSNIVFQINNVAAPPAFTDFTANLSMTNLALILYNQGNQLIAEAQRIQSLKTEEICYPDQVISITTLGGSNQMSQFKLKPVNQVSSLYKTYYGIYYPPISTGTTNRLIEDSNNIGVTTPAGVGQVVLPGQNFWGSAASTGGLMDNGKWQFLQQYVNSQLKLQLNAIQWDDYAHASNILIPSKNAFKSGFYYKFIGVIPNIFDSDYANQHCYNGQEMKGIYFSDVDKEINVTHQFTIAPGVITNIGNGGNLQHYMISIIMKKMYINNGIISYFQLPNK